MDEKGEEFIEPEKGQEDLPTEPEKETPPESLEKVLERQSEQAANEVAGLGQEGRSLEDVLTKREAEGGDIDDFKRGEEEIEGKAKKEEEEYNDSFRTPGDIESYIRSQEEEDVGTVEITDKRDEKYKTSRLKKCEEISETYKKYHPEAFSQLENIANDNGFKKFLVDNLAKKVHVNPEISKDAVFYAPIHFSRHENLMKEYDSSFAAKGANRLIRHEKRHLRKPTEILEKRKKNFIESLLKSEESRESFKKAAKERGFTFKEGVDRAVKAIKSFEEAQTDVISLLEGCDNKEEFMDNYASEGVYTSFLYDGEESLGKEYSFGEEAHFIKTDILWEIAKREKRIKDDLLKKYKEKQGISDEISDKK